MFEFLVGDRGVLVALVRPEKFHGHGCHQGSQDGSQDESPATGKKGAIDSK